MTTATMQIDDEPLIDVDEVRALLGGVSRKTVYRIPSTKLPRYPLGPRTTRWKRSDVIAFRETYRTAGARKTTKGKAALPPPKRAPSSAEIIDLDSRREN